MEAQLQALVQERDTHMRTKRFDKFIGTRVLAEILEISMVEVRKLIRKGLLTAYQLAYRCELRFKESDVLSYMERVDRGQLPVVGNPSWLTRKPRAIAA